MCFSFWEEYKEKEIRWYKSLELLQCKIPKSELVSTHDFVCLQEQRLATGQIFLILKGIVCGLTTDITLINLYFIITMLLFLHII